MHAYDVTLTLDVVVIVISVVLATGNLQLATRDHEQSFIIKLMPRHNNDNDTPKGQ